jgi:hypothetical protein
MLRGELGFPRSFVRRIPGQIGVLGIAFEQASTFQRPARAMGQLAARATSARRSSAPHLPAPGRSTYSPSRNSV